MRLAMASHGPTDFPVQVGASGGVRAAVWWGDLGAAGGPCCMASPGTMIHPPLPVHPIHKQTLIRSGGLPRWRAASGVMTAIALAALLALAACAPPMGLVDGLAEHYPDVLFRVATADSVIALTLDDGPSADSTPHVLALLAKHDARATFFLTGNRIPGREGLTRRIVLEGHELGNHGMRETPSILLSADRFADELNQAHRLLTEHDSVRWFRPATGFFDRHIIDEARQRGYEVALGSVYPNDVRRPIPSLLASYILSNVRPGDVIILHEGHTGRHTIVPVLQRILPELRQRGYRVVTLSELLESEES